MASKKDLPNVLKAAFKSKPYDIYAIRKYLASQRARPYRYVGYVGYDVYILAPTMTSPQKNTKMVRGNALISYASRFKPKSSSAGTIRR